jgi:hypothetical protein
VRIAYSGLEKCYISSHISTLLPVTENNTNSLKRTLSHNFTFLFSSNTAFLSGRDVLPSIIDVGITTGVTNLNT